MKRQSGFTLLEVLLAMMLLALIMALAYGGLRAGAKISTRGTVAIEETNRLRVAQTFVRTQLRRMLPLLIEVDDQEQPVLFVGESDHMKFVADMPGYLGQGGPQVQEIYIERSERSGRALQFQFSPLNLLDDTSYEPAEPVILFGGVKSARFEYAGLDEDGELGDWQSQWEESGQLPVLVAIRIETEDERVPFPDIVVSPMLDTAAGRQLIRPSFRGNTRQ